MEKWLHELIRKIPRSSFTTGVEAAVARDTDNSKTLCFKVYSHENKVLFGYHFNIEWLEDEERIDWLAHVLSSAFQHAYNKGKRDSENATACALKGFKQLLNHA